MANTYTQLHIHLIFVTKYRNASITDKFEKRLYEYLIAIIQNHNHKVLAINGMPDHIHILLGFRANQSISELVQLVKSSSSKWINDEKLTNTKFEWQEGFGAFSYSKSDVEKVIKYIKNQKTHHSKTSFKDEYLKILQNTGVDFDPKYIFHEPQ